MRARHLFAAIGIIFVLGAAGAAAGLAILWWQHTQPVTLPGPSGPWAVGRMQFDWRDPSRVDRFAPAAGTVRELTVWVWYPAARGTRGATVDYMPPPLRNALARHTGPVIRLLSHDLAKVQAHAMRDVPLSDAKAAYPVVIFKPGIGAPALDYTTLAEDLASHGFVVVASDSPYSTAVVVYADGRIATRTQAGHPVDEGMPAPPRQVIENVLDVWVADDHFVLDQLERLEPFSHRLDLRSVGAFGHSFGGAAALEFCREEPRCKGAIDVDGIPFGAVARGAAVDKPFLFFLSDHRNDRSLEDDGVRATIESIRKRLPNHPSYAVLLGSRHFNLSDQALTKNTRVGKAVGFLGPIDERRALAATADVIDAFFESSLNGKPDHLRSVAARYREIELR